MKYQVWYMKPSFLRGIVGNSPDPNNLSATHVHLKDIEADDREDACLGCERTSGDSRWRRTRRRAARCFASGCRLPKCYWLLRSVAVQIPLFSAAIVRSPTCHFRRL